MKLSRSSVRTLVAALAFMCLFAWVTPAFASLEDPPGGFSSTNPNAGDAKWRADWGNSLYPDWTFAAIPSDPPSVTTGFYYRWSRQMADPLPALSEKVGISWQPEGTTFTHVWDLAGIYASLPDAERDYVPRPGETIHDPREGIWYVTFRFYNDDRLASDFSTSTFGVDMTRPAKVIGFTSGISNVTESTRRNYTFLNTEYDELSGVYWYNLYIRYPNGSTKSIRHHLSDWMPGKVTIEDLQPGVNQVGISVTDRATNESPIVWHTDKVDPDVPSLAITYPAASAWLNGTKTFSVNSTDLAGKPVVTFKVDGVVKGTDSAPPYQLSVNTTKLSGGAHTFTAIATDLYGHKRTASRTFYVDNTPIRLSSMSISQNPFYPVLHDGYKDTTTMKVYLGEAATEAYLEVYDATGGMVRKYKKTNASAGTLSMSWDGKSSSGAVSTGTFWYRFVVKDRAGNWTRTGMSSVIIRDYEVVRVGPDTVRIVPR